MEFELKVLLFIIVVAVFTSFADGDENGGQIEALLKWKNSLENPSSASLFSWDISSNSSFSPCEKWVGIICDDGFVNIIHINLTSMGLKGMLQDLSNNSLYGVIPKSIGMLANLKILYVNANHFSGSIPSAIGNLTKLKGLHLSLNHLSGNIPKEIGLIASLVDLKLPMNNLSGSLPAEITNLTSMKILLMGNNRLSGYLPDSICSGGLLERLSVHTNRFIGPVPKDLKNCSRLVRVRFEENELTGNISEDFGVYPMLNYIDLSYNKFFGEISPNWGSNQNLKSFKVSHNNIAGSIPSELANATKLEILDLSYNQLVGKIQNELGGLKLLFNLELNDNQLSGNVPTEFRFLSELAHLNLAVNRLSGLVPEEFGQCSKLLYLNLSNNKLTAMDLDLSHNLLTGELPSELGYLSSLETLNLSHNQFSGYIPNTFDTMSSPLPNSKAFRNAPAKAFEHNKGLCCNAMMKKSKRKYSKMVLVSIIAPILSTLILLSIILGTFFTRSSRARYMVEPEGAGERENCVTIWGFDGKLMYESLIQATEDFNPKYCIGRGGSGSVYKAMLPTGQVFAVKKLHEIDDDDDVANLKSFSNEIDALTEVKHRNIVKLCGFCSHAKYSFLVYEYLEGGSLAKMLASEEKAKQLDWNKRIQVVKGVANALTYMHHECFPPVIHRDISSSNILLDSEYEARVSDFGTARILNPDSSKLISFAGTFGYSAPELAYGTEANEKCDVYSYGVLALEVIMGKHPEDLLLSLSLPESIIGHRFTVKDLLDHRLPPPEDPVGEEVVFTIKLAFSCLQTKPQSRPTMQQVSQKLLTRKPTLSDPLEMIKLEKLLVDQIL
ncbi:hypothetical protein V6Z11_D02G060000 [Gossypium hirsutum]